MAKRSQPYRPKVFISYKASGTDAEVAQVLRETLVANKVAVPAWRDKEDLRPGSRAILEIQAAIADCDFFLLLVSPRSVLKSRWCRREWGRADYLNKVIVPLIVEEVAPRDLPLELEGLQWIDVQRGLDKGLPQLLRLLSVAAVETGERSDPLDRDDRRIRALAHVFYIFAGNPAVSLFNVRHMISDLGKECLETERARRVVELIHNPKIRDYRDAGDALMRLWEAPASKPR